MMLLPSMEALKIGNARSVSAAAAVRKGRNVKEKPFRELNSALDLSRSFAILVMSTRWTVVTCAEVRLLITMCSAIFCRIVLIGSVRTFADSGSGRGTGAGAAAVAAC